MSKNSKGFIVVVAVLLAAGAAYVYYKKNQKPDLSTKEGMAKFLIEKKLATNLQTLISFDQGYLDAWVKGHQSGNSQFTYNGKSYRVTGGTAI